MDVIDVNGKAGVEVLGTTGHDTLDFTNVEIINDSVGDFEIDGGNNNDTITTSVKSATRYRGAHGNDTFILDPNINDAFSADATFLYAGTNNGLDNFVGNRRNEGTDYTILVETDGTVVGLASGFGVEVVPNIGGPTNSVDIINVNNNMNVTVSGTTGHDTLDFGQVKFQNFDSTFEIDGGNNNDKITISTESGSTGLTYIGGHGNDRFFVSQIQNGGFNDYFGGSGTDKIVVTNNVTTLGLGETFGPANSIEEIFTNRLNVKIGGSNVNNVWDFSATAINGFRYTSGNANGVYPGQGDDTVTFASNLGDTVDYYGDGGDDTYIYTTTSSKARIFNFNSQSNDKIDFTALETSGDLTGSTQDRLDQLDAITVDEGNKVRINLDDLDAAFAEVLLFDAFLGIQGKGDLDFIDPSDDFIV